MMAAFRAFAKSPVAIVLMGILIVSFGIWGVRDVFHAQISDSVVTAGSSKVGAQEFKRLFDRQLRFAQQQSGQALTAQQAVQAGLDREMLQQLADQESVVELLRRSGVRAADQLVVAQLRKIPQFFNPVTGAFDQASYQQALRDNGLTPVEFEKSLKDEIGADHFASGMQAGLEAPRVYSALFAILNLQARSADYFVLGQDAVPAPRPPTDAELTKFMKDNQDRLRRPELRVISLVRFSAQALAPTETVDPAMVQRLFDARKASLSTPERRSFVQVPAKDAAQAAQIAARLAKGDDPTAVGQAFGVKPISYPNTAKAAVADPEVADAAFGLQPGQTSGPIRGAFGYSVIKLASVTPGRPATIEDVRPQLQTEVQTELAVNQAEDEANKYGDAHAAGQPLAQAAKTAGEKVFTLGPLTADGKDYPTGQQEPALTQKMLSDAFTLPQGGETDVTSLGKGEYYALRVEKVTPPSLPSLDEIRPQLTQVYMAQQVMKALQDKGAALTAAIQKGQSVAAAAASAGVKPQRIEGLTIQAAREQAALGQDLLSKLFQAKPNDVFTVGIPRMGLAVVKLTEVRPGAPAAVAGLTQGARAELGKELNGEMGDMMQIAARELIKPKVDEKLARTTIGVAPEEGLPSSGAPAKAP